MAKGEAADHRDNERDRHFYDGPSQVFKMLEQRFRCFAFGQFAKLEKISKAHCDAA
jgi:hypothetical protein